MKRLAVLSSYYFAAICFWSIISFLYVAIFYPIESLFLPVDLSVVETSHGVIESSASAMELILLLPEIIVTGVAQIFGVHLGFSSLLHSAVDFGDSLNFLTCEVLILLIGLASLYLWQFLLRYSAKKEARGN
ncbi:MAG: hypothetical protein WBM44_03105 [Waterburya sp.]